MKTENNKKTILYLITQSEMGGAQKYIFDLVSHLKDEYNVEVGFGEQGETGELAIKLKEIGIKYHVIRNLKRKISFKNDFLAFWQIRKLIKKTKPDIVHLNSSKISILGSLASIFLKIKIIYTAHGWVFNEPDCNNFYKKAERFSAKFKNTIICVSEFDRQAALREKITEEVKLITVHNGVRPINFLERPEAQRKLKEKLPPSAMFKINEGDILIGSIGNLYKTKGFEYLINAGKLIINNNLHVKIIIIGKDGGEKEELENWIRQLGVQKNIILLGQLENASQILKAFDLYVCSSVKEGLSYTIIEAMLAGLPIVATSVGGNGELIEDQQTGILVDTQNAEKLAKQIINTLRNQELMNKMAINAKQKAEKYFTIGSMVEKTKNIYEEITQTHKQ